MSIDWMITTRFLPRFGRQHSRVTATTATELDALAAVAIELSDRSAARLNGFQKRAEVNQLDEFIRAGGLVTVRR